LQLTPEFRRNSGGNRSLLSTGTWVRYCQASESKIGPDSNQIRIPLVPRSTYILNPQYPRTTIRSSTNVCTVLVTDVTSELRTILSLSIIIIHATHIRRCKIGGELQYIYAHNGRYAVPYPYESLPPKLGSDSRNLRGRGECVRFLYVLDVTRLLSFSCRNCHDRFTLKLVRKFCRSNLTLLLHFYPRALTNLSFIITEGRDRNALWWGSVRIS